MEYFVNVPMCEMYPQSAMWRTTSLSIVNHLISSNRQGEQFEPDCLWVVKAFKRNLSKVSDRVGFPLFFWIAALYAHICSFPPNLRQNSEIFKLDGLTFFPISRSVVPVWFLLHSRAGTGTPRCLGPDPTGEGRVGGVRGIRYPYLHSW